MSVPMRRASLMLATLLLALGAAHAAANAARAGATPVAASGARHTRASRSGQLPPAQAVNAFGLGLMRRLGGANLVFSPDSIATALAMAGTGAAGRTAAQMAEVLHLSSPSAFAAVGRLQGTISAEQTAIGSGNSQAPTLDLADALFLQDGLSLEPAFLSTLQSGFGAPAQAVDFEGESAALQAINGWVEAHTQGIIRQILQALPAETRLVLADAIYLKASWSTPFRPDATAVAPFHGQGSPVPTPFMHETEVLPYGRGAGYAAVALPYQASTLSLLVLLPSAQSLGSLERRLDPNMLTRVIRGLAPRPVSLSLPRFHLALEAELNGPLKALGMTDAFSEAADFSRITPSEGLKVGSVEHAADFTVDEQGTIATAATVVTIEATAGRRFSVPPVDFDADRPFLFFLRDDRTGAVLFAGRLAQASPPPS